MKNNLYLRIPILVVIVALVMCVGISFFWNPKKCKYDVPREDDLVDTFLTDESFVLNNIEIGKDGTIHILGDDAYIELRDLEKKGRTLVFVYADKPDERISFATTLDYGDGVVETQDKVIYSVSLRFANCACIDLPDTDYKNIRIRPGKDMKIKSIEMHENEHVSVYKDVPNAGRNLAFGIMLGCLLTLVVFLLEWKYKFTEYVADFLIQNKNYIFQDVFVSVLAIFFSLVLSEMVYDGRFSFVYNVTVIAVGLSCFVIFRHLLLKDYPTERTCFELVVFAGVCMTFSCGPHVSWDAFIHYSETIASTRLFGEVALTDAEWDLLQMGGVPSDRTYSEIIHYYNSMTDGIKNWGIADFAIKRLPAVIGINLANLLGFFGYDSYFAGRFGQLFVYAVCVYFGMKRLHSGKMIYAVVAAFPVNIFLATNYSYDYIVTGFIMLGMAYFVAMCQEKEEPVKDKDVIVMLLAFVIACQVKVVYLPILLFPFLVSRKKIKNNKKYYAFCVIAFLLVVAFLAKDTIHEIQKGGDPRLGQGEVDPVEQLSYILEHPMVYAKLLTNYLLQIFNPARIRIGTMLAYLGTGSGYNWITTILAIVTLTDKNESDQKAYSSLVRVYSVLHFIGVSAIITTALYLSFSPVGSDYMDGAQPRYYIPVIYPLCAVICGRGLQIKKYIPEKIYETVILGIVFAINYLNIYQLAFLTAI